MDPGILALLIPLIGVSIPLAWVLTNHRQKIAKMQIDATATAAAEKAAQYAGSIQQLEDRVRVLERIVTDSGYNTSAQIEALRDTRRVEDEGSGVPLGLDRKERA